MIKKIKLLLLTLFIVLFLYTATIFVQNPIWNTLGLTTIFFIAMFLTLWSISYDLGLFSSEIYPTRTERNAVYYVGNSSEIKNKKTEKKVKYTDKIEEIHEFLDNLED